MILEFSKDNKTLMLISLIFVILSGLGLIISIIRLIITKKHRGYPNGQPRCLS